MKSFKHLVFHNAGCVVCAALFHGHAALPAYTCKMTKEVIQIDGVLNEKIWGQVDTLKFKGIPP